MYEDFVKNWLTGLLLRLALAAIFVFHGLNLVTGYTPDQFVKHWMDNDLHLDGGGPTEWGATWMNAMAEKQGQQPPPAVVQMAVAWGQLVGGLALVIGLLTRVAALGLIIIMAGAIAVVHAPNGFDVTKGGFEYNMLIIVVCLVLVFSGAGNVALDRLFRRRRP
jgi:putative oxidoreductase